MSIKRIYGKNKRESLRFAITKQYQTIRSKRQPMREAKVDLDLEISRKTLFCRSLSLVNLVKQVQGFGRLEN